MNGNEYRRRYYSQTVSYRYSDDASTLTSNFNSCLKLHLHSEEPMDVDCDDYENTDDNIPTSDDATSIDQSLKNYRLADEYNVRQKYQLPGNENCEFLIKKESSKSYSKILASVLLILFGIFCYSFMNYDSKMDNTSMLQNIAEELQAHVLFQDENIGLILQNFQCVNTSDECRTVLPFVGSTGLGKSLVVNIIKKHFPDKYVNEINLIRLNTVQEQENIVKTISERACNLIIMDNLRFEHVSSVLNIVNALPNARCLFVIPIFNIQETDDNVAHVIHYEDFENISSRFKDSSFKYEPVLFNVMNEDVVKKWLQNLLINRNIGKNHFTVVRDILEHHDVKHHGFKGIEAKVNLLLHHCSQ